MREKHIYFMLLAFSAIFAFALLSSCGSGVDDLIDASPDTGNSEEIKMTNYFLTGYGQGEPNPESSFIYKCIDQYSKNQTIAEGCDQINIVAIMSEPSEPSSSSEEEQSSSSEEEQSSSSGVAACIYPPGDDRCDGEQSSSSSRPSSNSTPSSSSTTPSSSSTTPSSNSTPSSSSTTPSSSSTTPSSSSTTPSSSSTTPSSSSQPPSSSSEHKSSSSSSPSSSSTGGGGGSCGPNYGGEYSNASGNAAKVGCFNFPKSCHDSSPLKIYNDNAAGGTWTGTVICGDSSPNKTITCSTNGVCETAACASDNGAWVNITSITGNGGQIRVSCY